jgi:hypothetical protein
MQADQTAVIFGTIRGDVSSSPRAANFTNRGDAWRRHCGSAWRAAAGSI